MRVTLPRVGPLWKVGGVTSLTVTDLLPASGVIIKKLSPTVCFVQFHGTVPFTVYSGLTPGRVYVVGTNGMPATYGDANYPPTGGAHAFQQIGVATSDDELLVHPLSSAEGQPAPPGGSRFFQQTLAGAIDDVNVTFVTSLKFVSSGPSKEALFYNGAQLEPGAGNDYTVSESGGPGTGFDTVTMLFAPRIGDKLWIDFVPAP